MKTPRNIRQLVDAAHPVRLEAQYERWLLALVRRIHRRVVAEVAPALRDYRRSFRRAAKAQRQDSEQPEPTPDMAESVQRFIQTTLALSAASFATEVLLDPAVVARLERFALGVGAYGIARTRAAAVSAGVASAIPSIGVLEIVSPEVLASFVQENTALITRLTEIEVARMQRVVSTSVRAGMDPRSLAKLVAESLDVAEGRARLIARDQTSKLTGQVNQATQQTAGITRYRWVTSRDARVRKRHAELDTKIFSWDEPPVVDKRTGRRAHPGGDFQCRCYAVPIFDAPAVSQAPPLSTNGVATVPIGLEALGR